MTLEIGQEQWPFPIPLIKTNGAWFFDTIAGEEEIINRHIGRDEYYAIGVCRAYVKAQREYASRFAEQHWSAKIRAEVQEHARKDGRFVLAGGDKQHAQPFVVRSWLKPVWKGTTGAAAAVRVRFTDISSRF